MAGTTPQINDLVIRGYLLSIDEGSAAKRVAIGFGSGASELRVAVEGFQMTAQGLRKLGSGTTDSGGSKGPGGVLGVAALIATGNPVGLIIGTGVKVYGEESGSSTVEGRAKADRQGNRRCAQEAIPGTGLDLKKGTTRSTSRCAITCRSKRCSTAPIKPTQIGSGTPIATER